MDDNWEMDGGGPAGVEDRKAGDKRTAKAFAAVPACGQCIKKSLECVTTV